MNLASLVALAGWLAALSAEAGLVASASPALPGPALPLQCLVRPAEASHLILFKPARPAQVRKDEDSEDLQVFRHPSKPVSTPAGTPADDPDDSESEQCESIEDCPDLLKGVFHPGEHLLLLAELDGAYCAISTKKHRKTRGWVSRSAVLMQGVDLDAHIRQLAKLGCKPGGIVQFRKALEAARIPLNQAGEDGETLLMATASCGAKASVAELLEQSAKLTPTDRDGNTAIMRAAASAPKNEGTEALEILVGAAPASVLNRRNHAGISALDLAIDAGSPARAKILLDHGAAIENVGAVARVAADSVGKADPAPYKELITLLLAHGGRIEFRDAKGEANLRTLRQGCELLRQLKRPEGEQSDCAPPKVTAGHYFYCDPRDGKTEAVDVPAVSGGPQAVVFNCASGMVCSLPIQSLEALAEAPIDVLDASRFRWVPDDQACGPGCVLRPVLFAQDARRVEACTPR